jgi:L-amino acid N-acyltransferase YncA
MIRDATAADVDRLCAIYNHYVLNTVITFEEEPVSSSEMTQRVADVQQQLMWLVYETDYGVIGYAYASRWKVRAAYRFAVEASVYVDRGHHGKGVGKALYAALLERLRETKVHSVVGGVAGANPASFGLHDAFGFKKVAQFHEIGHKFGQWIDVTYFQLLL